MIAVFTKFDIMIKICWSQLDDKRFDKDSFKIAAQNAQELFKKEYLSQVQERTKNSPRGYVCLKGMIFC